MHQGIFNDYYNIAVRERAFKLAMIKVSVTLSTEYDEIYSKKPDLDARIRLMIQYGVSDKVMIRLIGEIRKISQEVYTLYPMSASAQFIGRYQDAHEIYLRLIKGSLQN